MTGEAPPHPKILRLDSSGQPIRWLSWQQATILYSLGKIAWTMGEHEFVFHGGMNRHTGTRSVVTINSIIAVKGHTHRKGRVHKVPPLTNRALFLRDQHMCMYCGTQLENSLLTRDHIVPVSRGGKDTWCNVVTACRACNTRKGGRTAEEANMPLLAVPFVPNYAEFLALSNRRILADQMDFLRAQFGNDSRLLQHRHRT
ncbi:MAG: HNH endonuclease [Gammaproteobacteria bacterium]